MRSSLLVLCCLLTGCSTQDKNAPLPPPGGVTISTWLPTPAAGTIYILTLADNEDPQSSHQLSGQQDFKTVNNIQFQRFTYTVAAGRLITGRHYNASLATQVPPDGPPNTEGSDTFQYLNESSIEIDFSENPL